MKPSRQELAELEELSSLQKKLALYIELGKPEGRTVLAATWMGAARRRRDREKKSFSPHHSSEEKKDKKTSFGSKERSSKKY